MSRHNKMANICSNPTTVHPIKPVTHSRHPPMGGVGNSKIDKSKKESAPDSRCNDEHVSPSTTRGETTAPACDTTGHHWTPMP